MRRSIPLAAIAGVTLALAACSGSGSGSGSTASATASAKPTLSGTLTMWVDETRIDSMKPIVDEFQQQTGVKVDLVQKVSGDIRTDFVSQVPTGQGPDVIIGAHDWTGEFVNNGVVATVQLGDKAKDFSKSAVSAFAYNGQQYGVPYAIDFLNPAPDFERDRITPHYFEIVVEKMAQLVVDRALTGKPSQSWPRWAEMTGLASMTGPV